jgi:hypothetical protein
MGTKLGFIFGFGKSVVFETSEIIKIKLESRKHLLTFDVSNV